MSSIDISTIKVDIPSVKVINSSVTRNRVVDHKSSTSSTDDDEEDYTYVPSNIHLSQCSNKIVAYIAGFVVYRLRKSLHCEVCIDVLTDTNVTVMHSLIKLKTKGGLIYPSNDVIEICVCCEKMYREITSCRNSPDISLGRVDFHKLVHSVFASYTNKEVFSKLSENMFEIEPIENHMHLLKKSIAEKYLPVRHAYAEKQFTAWLQAQVKEKSCQIYTKLINFSGQ